MLDEPLYIRHIAVDDVHRHRSTQQLLHVLAVLLLLLASFVELLLEVERPQRAPFGQPCELSHISAAENLLRTVRDRHALL